MTLSEMTIDERLDCLQELLSCTGKMYRWTYDCRGELLNTNCPDLALDKAFRSTGCMQEVLSYSQDNTAPMIMSVPFGLTWSTTFEVEEEEIVRIHVFGPVTSTELSYDVIRKASLNEKAAPNWRPKLIRILQRVPVVSAVDFARYTLMLHYCVTGNKLTNADIVFREPNNERVEQSETAQKDRMNTYLKEKALLRMVSEGDLNYKTVFQEAASASQGVRLAKMGSLEQIKVSQIVFISLCTRAAIEGGITPEIAYTRGDAYIQDILSCKTLTDAAHIGHTMYDDFIHLVHKGHANPNLSVHIQNCCDYIDLHVEDKLTLSEIARTIGYVDYYLSRKFKMETGMSINDYIKNAKIERAKTLLLATDRSIQEICDQLNFGSRSFFAETFKEITGIPPAAFREQSRR